MSSAFAGSPGKPNQRVAVPNSDVTRTYGEANTMPANFSHAEKVGQGELRTVIGEPGAFFCFTTGGNTNLTLVTGSPQTKATPVVKQKNAPGSTKFAPTWG